MNKIKRLLGFMILTLLITAPVTVLAQEYDYKELGTHLPLESTWTTFDDTFDLLIPYYFLEEEITAEESEDGIIYKALYTDDGTEACRMMIVKDELEESMDQNELYELVSALQMNISNVTINDIPVIQIYEKTSQPLHAILYMKDNAVYSVILKILDNSAMDIEILFYSLFLAEEETHKTLIQDMDPVLSKLAQNFSYVME